MAANLDGPFEPPKWLWDGRVPLGELTIIAGRGEVGKTTMVIDLAAQLSRGELSGVLSGHRGKTIFFSDEASFEGVITPRYAAAGGAPGGLYKLDFLETGVSTHHSLARPMTLRPSDIRMLTEKIVDEGISLLVFDPIDMLLGRVNSYRNTEVREALSLIMSTGCTVIGIAHLTKGSNVPHAGDRLMGSAAYRNFARSVLVVAHDRSDRDLIVLAHDKSNAGPRQNSLSLKMVASPVEGFVRVEWLDEVSVTADDLLVNRGRSPALVEQCRLWLALQLERRGAIAPKDVLRLALDEGFGRTTVYDARKLLGVSNDKYGRWAL